MSVFVVGMYSTKITVHGGNPANPAKVSVGPKSSSKWPLHCHLIYPLKDNQIHVEASTPAMLDISTQSVANACSAFNICHAFDDCLILTALCSGCVQWCGKYLLFRSTFIDMSAVWVRGQMQINRTWLLHEWPWSLCQVLTSISSTDSPFTEPSTRRE